MLFKRVVSACLLLFAGLVVSSGAQAQTLVSARILSSSGPVEIQRRTDGQSPLVKITYRVNDELLAGDVIRTAGGGRLVLGLLDGSQAVIGEKTVVEIADLSKSPRTIFNVLRGKTRVKIEKIGGRPNPYRVNTPTTVIAVRGTLFDVLVSETETQVFVHEGEVSVSNFAKPESPVILLPGQRTRVRETQAPEPPTDFQPGRNDDKFRPNGRGDGPKDGQRPEKGDGRPDQNAKNAGGPDPNQPGAANDQPPPRRDPGGPPGGGRRP